MASPSLSPYRSTNGWCDSGCRSRLRIRLYQEDVLSLGQASRIAGLAEEDFIERLGAAGVAVARYPADELADEMAVLQVQQKRRPYRVRKPKAVSETCIVADAGPLIGLARISRLELLRSLFTSTILPPAVYTECVSASGKPGAAAIAQAVDDRWLTVRAPSKPAPRDLPTGIGPGEREAIACCGTGLSRSHGRQAGSCGSAGLWPAA